MYWWPIPLRCNADRFLTDPDTLLQRVPTLPKEQSVMLTPIPRQLTLAPLIDDAGPHGDVEQPARIVEVSTSPFHFMLLTADGQAISVGRICPAPVRTHR